MKNHKELFTALLDREELVNKFNGKTLKINDDGDAVLISKNWHNFNPSEWEIAGINTIQEVKNNDNETNSEIKD